jgi:hypothetical protein
MAWINWDSVCVPKEDGGLGVRRILTTLPKNLLKIDSIEEIILAGALKKERK